MVFKPLLYMSYFISITAGQQYRVFVAGSDVARRTSEVDSGSLFGGVFAGIILFAFVIIIAVLIIR
jgi:hypothetical protein